jgi:hypothetical protein
LHDDEAIGADPRHDLKDQANRFVGDRVRLAAERVNVRGENARHVLADLHVAGLSIESHQLRAAEHF